MTRTRPIAAASSRQRGFTLIEVLIAVLVLAIGLLGLASLTAVSMQYNRGALLRTQATNLAYDITDAMRANRARALAGDYDTEDCDPAGDTLADDDLSAWCQRVGGLLPSGEAEIDVAGDGIVDVTIRWDSSRDTNAPDAPTTTEFVFRTRL